MTCHNIFLASKTLRKLYREYYRYMYLMLILDLVDNNFIVSSYGECLSHLHELVHQFF